MGGLEISKTSMRIFFGVFIFVAVLIAHNVFDSDLSRSSQIRLSQSQYLAELTQLKLMVQKQNQTMSPKLASTLNSKIQLASLTKQLKDMQAKVKSLEKSIPSISKKTQYSAISCSDESKPGKFSDRVCQLKNFCMNKKYGIFPKYPVQPHTLTDEQVHIQLSSYIEEGYEVYWKPTLKFNKGYFSHGSKPLKNRKGLFVYAPAAWPEKVPVHYWLNNMLPAYRQLVNFIPERKVKYSSHYQVWKYNIDLLGVDGGFASNGIQKPKLYKWLGIDHVFTMQNKIFRPNVHETICYDNVYAGVGGHRGSQWGDLSRLNDDAFLNDFRKAYLNFAGCWPEKGKAKKRQSSHRAPVVTLIQREEGGNDNVFGRRVFDNINELDSLLKKKASQGIVEYKGYYIFNKTVPIEHQACVGADTSILIGIHGNALGLELFMEPKTVLIEVAPRNEYYQLLSEITGVHRLKLHIQNRTTPPIKKFEATLMKGVKLWQRSFSDNIS